MGLFSAADHIWCSSEAPGCKTVHHNEGTCNPVAHICVVIVLGQHRGVWHRGIRSDFWLSSFHETCWQK